MRLRIFLLMAAAVMSLLSMAQPLVKEGVKWISKVYGTGTPELKETVQTVTVRKCMDGNTEALGLFVSDGTPASEEVFLAYISTKEDKVYFKPALYAANEWFLMYDMGLTPGEGCTVYSPGADRSNMESRKSYVYCTGLNEVSDYDGFQTLSLQEYRDESRKELLYDGSIWIKDLGSDRGILWNNGMDWLGIGAVLYEVWDGDRLVYKNETSCVTGIEDKSFPAVLIDGLNITISGCDKAECGVYSSDGTCLYQFISNEENRVLRLPGKGIYIIKVGNHSRIVSAN